MSDVLTQLPHSLPYTVANGYTIWAMKLCAPMSRNTCKLSTRWLWLGLTWDRLPEPVFWLVIICSSEALDSPNTLLSRCIAARWTRMVSAALSRVRRCGQA